MEEEEEEEEEEKEDDDNKLLVDHPTGNEPAFGEDRWRDGIESIGRMIE